jgi:hypothetical protein
MFVRILPYICPHTAVYVSTYCYICMLMYSNVCSYDFQEAAEDKSRPSAAAESRSSAAPAAAAAFGGGRAIPVLLRQSTL